MNYCITRKLGLLVVCPKQEWTFFKVWLLKHDFCAAELFLGYMIMAAIGAFGNSGALAHCS